MKSMCISLAMVVMPTLRAERLQDGVTLTTDAKNGVEDEDAYAEFISDAATCQGDDKFKDGCYQTVLQKTRDAADRGYMARYVGDLCVNEQLTVQDDVALEAFVKYFDDECELSGGTQTFDRLKLGLHAAANENCAGNDWLKRTDETASSLGQLLDSVELTSVMKDAMRDAQVAMHNMYKSRRASHPYDKDGRETGIRDFTQQCLELADIPNTRSLLDAFATARQEEEDSEQTYAKFFVALEAFLKEKRNELPHGDGEALSEAEITEKLAVINGDDVTDFNNAKSDARKMAIFIHKLADGKNYVVLNYGDLLGMAPWYTTTEGCSHYGTSTAVNLIEEIDACAYPEGTGEGGQDDAGKPLAYRCGGWIQKM